MKARIKATAEKKLLVINPTEEHLGKLEELTEQADAKMIITDDLDKTVGELLGEKVTAAKENDSPDCKYEALLFAGFDKKALDSFLDALKKNGVDISLKAVVTPYNRSWYIGELLCELAKEHAQFTGGDL